MLVGNELNLTAEYDVHERDARAALKNRIAAAFTALDLLGLNPVRGGVEDKALTAVTQIQTCLRHRLFEEYVLCPQITRVVERIRLGGLSACAARLDNS